MSYQYKRLNIQGPKSYEELTRNRPTKKKNYNYTLRDQFHPSESIMPLSTYKITASDFSFLDQKQSKTSQLRASKFTDQNNNYSIKEKLTLKLKHESPIPKPIGSRLSNINQFTFKVDSPLYDPRKQFIINTLFQQSQENTPISQSQESSSSHNYTQQMHLQNEADKFFKSKQSYIKIQDPFISRGFLPQNKLYLQESSSAEKTHQQANKQKLTPVSLACEVSQVKTNKKDNQSITPLSIKPSRKAQYFYGQKQVDTEKIKQQVERKYEHMVKKEKFLSKNSQLDLQIAQIKRKILYNSPLMLPVGLTEQLFPQKVEASSQKPNLQIENMAKQICKLIETDITLLTVRQVFQLGNQQDKWVHLKCQLEVNNVFMTEIELKQVIQISPYQRNPFATAKVGFSAQCIKQLSKIYAHSQKIWNQQLEKSFMLQKLNQQSSSEQLLELQSKGEMDLQDLVCFLNLNSARFFRSRDLVPLFRRFLKLEGKNIAQSIGKSKIAYKTFIQKLAK